LVELLTARGKATISLVAEVDGTIVGHILFSPATVGPPCRGGPEPQHPARQAGSTWPTVSTGLGLAPVAVHPDFQNHGIGSALVRAGLAECRRLATVRPADKKSEVGGQRSDDDNPASDFRLPTSDLHSTVHWIVLLGHETYYPRFGFAPASRWNLIGDYGSSGAFQFLPLTAAANEIRGGHIRYAPEFDELFPSELANRGSRKLCQGKNRRGGRGGATPL
jgi:putative acetyltransferase